MALTPTFERFSSVPRATGLFDPRREKDACGLAMVATLRGTAGHDIIDAALNALRNLEHRGAIGSDAGTGDGAGIVTQIPDEFFRAVLDFDLPAAGSYAAGMSFLPTDDAERAAIKKGIEKLAAEEHLEVLGWRDVPVRPSEVGDLARGAMPVFEQVFIESNRQDATGEQVSGLLLDRQVYRLRKRAERELHAYFPSLSSRTIVYKGMVTTLQLEPFYPDLSDPRFMSKLALVGVRGKEGHADHVAADGGKLEVDHGTQEGVGDLRDDAGAVAGSRIRPDGTAVLEVAQRAERGGDDVMASGAA